MIGRRSGVRIATMTSDDQMVPVGSKAMTHGLAGLRVSPSSLGHQPLGAAGFVVKK